MAAHPRSTGFLAMHLPSAVMTAAIMIAPFLYSPSRAAEASKSHTAGHASGAVDFPVSCSRQAQAQFNDAVTLLHHMTYPQARQGFSACSPSIRSARWRTGESR